MIKSPSHGSIGLGDDALGWSSLPIRNQVRHVAQLRVTTKPFCLGYGGLHYVTQLRIPFHVLIPTVL
jgi:hypothetical protein